MEEPLLTRASSPPGTSRRKMKKKSEREGKSLTTHNKKRGVQRSKSGSAVARKTNGRVLRSKSEDDEVSASSNKLKSMSKAIAKATDTSSLSSSKRNKRKVKKSASGGSKARSPTNSVSPIRRSFSPISRSVSPNKNSGSPLGRSNRTKSPNNEGGGHRPANRRSSLSKMYSWWDIATSSKHAKLDDDDILPPPPPPRHISSARSTNTRTMMRKRSDRELPPTSSPVSARSVKSAVVSKRKKSKGRRKQSFDSIEDNNTLEISTRSKNSLLSNIGGNEDDDDNHSKTSQKKKRQPKKETTIPNSNSNSNYATLLDSPSTSSMTSTTSGESLKNRLKNANGIPQVASLGALFDMAPRSDNMDTDEDDDIIAINDASELQIQWVELSLENAANVVLKTLKEDDVSVETTVVQADSTMMNTSSDDLSNSVRSTSTSSEKKNKKKIKSPTRSRKQPSKAPSLGDTIGRDRRAVLNQPSDERTLESEQTTKVANYDPRTSNTVHETGSEELKPEENDEHADDDVSLEGASSHSRSSPQSPKSLKPLPTTRCQKKHNGSGSSHERRVGGRKRNSRRQQTTRTRSKDAPRRTRSGRPSRRADQMVNKSPTKPSSEIDNFMAMTKDTSAQKDLSSKEHNTDGTMSTATPTSITTDATMRSRRSSVGNLNPNLIQSFQLTF
ncbi:MAG: hypothetical protein SGBAC_005819 [Bacillariaceae sp.]